MRKQRLREVKSVASVTQHNKDLNPELLDPEPQTFQLFHSQLFLLKLSKLYICSDTGIPHASSFRLFLLVPLPHRMPRG